MRSDELRDRSALPYEAGEPMGPAFESFDLMAVSEFKATCLRVLEQIRKTGRPLLITKRGVPLAQVLPPPPQKALGTDTFGCMAGTAKELGNILEPLEAEDWEALQ